MTRYIEYYEVKTREGYEYYYMPLNHDAFNKQSLDSRCHRIWKFDTKTNRIHQIYNIREGKPEANRAEFLKIQLMSRPVPYSEYYTSLQEVKEYRERREAEKSATLD